MYSNQFGTVLYTYYNKTKFRQIFNTVQKSQSYVIKAKTIWLEQF